MHNNLLPYRGAMPKIAADAFIAPSAVIIGDVVIGAGSGVWFNCVVRGDVNVVRIGERVNIQDGTVIHVSSVLCGTEIGDDVSIGHMALVHACTLESGSFVGMGAIVMDGCVLESESMIAAGSMLTPGKRVPKGQLWGGRPAKFMRELGEEDYRLMRGTAANYAYLARQYRNELAAGAAKLD